MATTDIKYNKGHRWGRPKKNSLQSPTGPKSLYKPSEYYTNLTNTIDNPPTAELIFSLLSHSGMLYKLLNHMNLVSFYIVKENDRKKAWNILHARNLTTFKDESDFVDDFNKIKSVEDKTLRQMADIKARSLLQNSLAENYRELFLVGGLFFQA